MEDTENSEDKKSHDCSNIRWSINDTKDNNREADGWFKETNLSTELEKYQKPWTGCLGRNTFPDEKGTQIEAK